MSFREGPPDNKQLPPAFAPSTPGTGVSGSGSGVGGLAETCAVDRAAGCRARQLRTLAEMGPIEVTTRSRLLSSIVLSWACSALISACAPADAERASAVTDSAGVELVYSEIPAATGSAEWSISPEPIAEIRPDPGDSAALLYRVVGVSVLPDGKTAVANLGDNTIRFYAATGALIRKVGGSGEGPSEFRQLRGLVQRDSELWAYQILPHPAKAFDFEGGYLRSVSVPPVTGPRLHGFLADGTVVATMSQRISPTNTSTDSAALIRFGSVGLDTIAVLPALKRIGIDGIGPEAQALGPTLFVAAADTLVYTSFSNSWDIAVWRDTVLVRRVRKAADPVPVTREHREAYREALLKEGSDNPRVRQAYETLADNMAYPDHHPLHSRMMLDRSGMLWVNRPQTEPPWSEAVDYSPVPPHPSTWDVMSPEGEWLSTVVLPARFRVLEIGEDYVAGVARNDMDVESVAIWGLNRPN